MALNLEPDAFATAEWVEQSLAVCFELSLVMEMHHELTLYTFHEERVAHVELLGIIGHEPVDESEADGARACQNRERFLESPRLIVEVLEPPHNEILFALDAVLEGLTTGVHPS